ncbi:MAG: glycoside hydrolase family 3 protein [Firmicutes bacterium]|nr:glycoside hydrolase family 3 protein [Bacillota bacterium]
MKKKTFLAVFLCMAVFAALLTGCGSAERENPADGSEPAAVETGDVEAIVSGMTLDEKISQMIIPAIRTWNGENVTDLAAFPELEEVLQKHQYGGVILFGANITGTEQTARLVYDLQANNLAMENVTSHIPYFMPLDEEGGIVTRLVSGTRMTGNMAIGATGASAEENAETTGKIIGEELAALGFNVDFAPVIDVNNNAANPVIGTRSFSDDAETVARLGTAYARGLQASHIIATYKHFPGHGDTATDSHIGTPSVEKTYEDILATELLPFQAAIDNGAEMIMTAHITYPLIDEEVVYGDGVTKGYYPATMSKKMMGDILRGDLGFDGVIVTDALEMDAIRTAGLVPGAEDSTKYWIHIAEKVINAGVDILLLPMDLKNEDAALFYDDYIAGLAALTEAGTIPQEKIDESVTRILRLKEKYGMLDGEYGHDALEAVLEKAAETVGSDAHHETEAAIARQAITMVKNGETAIPLNKEMKNLVFLGCQEQDCIAIQYAVDKLRDAGLLAQDAHTVIDYYYDGAAEGEKQLHLTGETKAAIDEADAVIALTASARQSALERSTPQNTAIYQAIERTHAAGGRFVLISVNLPYDAARFQDADAILLAYMGSGLNMDPTERKDASSDRMAFNANVIAALETVFGGNHPNGTLPVNIPVIEETPDGGYAYGEDNLYERGFGLHE